MNKLEKAAVISVIGNLLLSLLKFIVGSVFGSIALIADAIHSFTDIISSTALFFGIRFSGIKSKTFPYGLYKLENLVSLFIAVIIFWGGIEVLRESIEKFSSPTQMISLVPIAAAIISVVIVFALTKYKERVGREEASPSMLSEAKHSMLDVYGTIGVLAAVSLSFAGFPLFDPIIGFLIGLLVFKAGAEIFIDSTKVLLDASLDYKTMKKIEKAIAEEKNVKVKELTARNSGRYIFIELKLETDVRELKKVDQLRKKCEEKIKKRIPRIDKMTIEVDFKKKDVLVYAVPLQEKKEEAGIALEFGTAPYFGLFKTTNKPKEKKVIEVKVIENPHAREKTKRGILAAELLAKNKADVLFSKEEMHKGGGFYALQENFIEIRLTEAKNFKQLLNEFKGES